MPFLLGILLKLGNDLYRTNPLTVLLINKYFLRLLHLMLALFLFLQIFLRVRSIQINQKELGVVLFGTINQDLLLSFYANIFMIFVFVVCTYQIKTIDRLTARFKLKELDFWQRPTQ